MPDLSQASLHSRDHQTADLILGAYLEVAANTWSSPGLREVAAATPVAPSTITHHFGDIDGLHHAAEQRAHTDLLGEAGGEAGLAGLVARIERSRLGRLLGDPTRHHRPWPGDSGETLGLDPAVDAGQLVDDLLAIVGWVWSNHATPEARTLARGETEGLVRLLTAAHGRQPPPDPELHGFDFDVVASAIPQAARSERHATVLRAVHDLALDGVVATARALAEQTGLSLGQLYRLGTLREFRQAYDEVLVATLMSPHGIPQTLFTLLRTGIANEEFFSYIVKKGALDPGPLYPAVVSMLEELRSSGDLRYPELPIDVLAGFVLAPYIRRFRNRKVRPSGWDNSLHFAAGAFQALAGMDIAAEPLAPGSSMRGAG